MDIIAENRPGKAYLVTFHDWYKIGKHWVFITFHVCKPLGNKRDTSHQGLGQWLYAHMTHYRTYKWPSEAFQTRTSPSPPQWPPGWNGLFFQACTGIHKTKVLYRTIQFLVTKPFYPDFNHLPRNEVTVISEIICLISGQGTNPSVNTILKIKKKTKNI